MKRDCDYWNATVRDARDDTRLRARINARFAADDSSRTLQTVTLAVKRQSSGSKTAASEALEGQKRRAAVLSPLHALTQNAESVVRLMTSIASRLVKTGRLLFSTSVFASCRSLASSSAHTMHSTLLQHFCLY